MERIDSVSPRALARITGVVYLLFFLTAIAGEFFLRQAGFSGIQLGAPSDAAATANAILAHESSYRLGFALGLVSDACYVAFTGLLYQLLKPVSRSLSLVAVLFSLMGLAVMSSASVFQLAPLVILHAGSSWSGFDTSQQQALMLMFLNVGDQIGSISLVFDGLFLLLIGYLIFRSTFLPRLVGALLALAGLGWLTFLSPTLASYLYTYIQIVGVVAEASLMLWLLVLGVNSQRWQEQARAAHLPGMAGSQEPARAGWESRTPPGARG